MSSSRILIDVPLRPAMGSRFQPTGFPDLGAALFRRPNGVPTLLVESSQSMANRLEGVAWDDATQAPLDLFEGMPYVRVVADDGTYLTASRTEAHRLASAFIKDSTLDGRSMVDVIREGLGLRDDRPIDHRAVAAAIFRLDPFALIHGVFFADAKWPSQPKVARAVTAFVEASGAERAESGGVKRDHVRHSIAEGSGGSSEGYGSVPFARTEWVASEIVASFGIDVRQLRSYGLSSGATDLLRDVALWQIRTLAEDGMRLRTACDLVPIDAEIRDTDGQPLPTISELEDRIRAGIAASAADLAGAETITVVWDGGGKKERKDKK